ncbi:Carbon-nitrogen hydrolase [Globomyces sp. JEL0801]|nr:Carbon-nitrogen hydrolase [Globomyces sp. JEL0801]
MRITLIQNSPIRSQIQTNINSVNELIKHLIPNSTDLILLPELCFTGYVFKSKDSIQSVLNSDNELSSRWAKDTAIRLNCFIQYGHPRITESGSMYNSISLINPDGTINLTYDKHFLFEVDEHWAEPGESFLSRNIPRLGGQVGFGICMDVNPYKFTAPFEDFEFGNFHLTNQSKLVLLSMAWLKPTKETPEKITLDMMNYWALRLSPLIKSADPVTVCICNRIGEEDDVVFGGSSCILRFDNGKVFSLGSLSFNETGVLQVEV